MAINEDLYVKTGVCSIFIADTNDIGCSCCSSCSFKGYLDRNNTVPHNDNDGTIIDTDGCRSNVLMDSGKHLPSKPAEVTISKQPEREIRQQKEQAVWLLAYV